MTNYYDFTLAPLRNILGPVYDAYRKTYDYTWKLLLEGRQVSTIENNPQPDMVEDRPWKFEYSVYGPVDMPVKAGVVGVKREILMQNEYPDIEKTDTGLGRYRREPTYLPANTPMQEIFVDMPYALKTDKPCSTVATRH